MNKNLKQLIDYCNHNSSRVIKIGVNEFHKCFPSSDAMSSLYDSDELNRWVNHIRAVHGIECRFVENSAEPPYYQFKKY